MTQVCHRAFLQLSCTTSSVSGWSGLSWSEGGEEGDPLGTKRKARAAGPVGFMVAPGWLTWPVEVRGAEVRPGSPVGPQAPCWAAWLLGGHQFWGALCGHRWGPCTGSAGQWPGGGLGSVHPCPGCTPFLSVWNRKFWWQKEVGNEREILSLLWKISATFSLNVSGEHHAEEVLCCCKGGGVLCSAGRTGRSGCPPRAAGWARLLSPGWSCFSFRGCGPLPGVTLSCSALTLSVAAPFLSGLPSCTPFIPGHFLLWSQLSLLLEQSGFLLTSLAWFLFSPFTISYLCHYVWNEFLIAGICLGQEFLNPFWQSLSLIGVFQLTLINLIIDMFGFRSTFYFLTPLRSLPLLLSHFGL